MQFLDSSRFISSLQQFSQAYHSDESWTSVSLAFINSGGLRGDFEIGNITMYDVLTVLPFKNSIDIVTIRGKHLLETFEFVAGGEWATEADGSRTKAGSGRFLQVSGFHLIVDPGMEEGHRVRQLLVRCSACKIPRYTEPRKKAIPRLRYSLTGCETKSHNQVGALLRDLYNFTRGKLLASQLYYCLGKFSTSNYPLKLTILHHIRRFFPIEMETEYKVATVSYLANGGDGLKLLKEKATSRLRGPLDTDVFVDYIRRVNPITQGVENRYTVLRSGQHLQTTSGTILFGSSLLSALLPLLICSFTNHMQK